MIECKNEKHGSGMVMRRLKAVAKPFRRFGRDRSGVAAVEFAIVAPLLLVLYLGGTDLSEGLEVNKKVSRSASILADLVARQLSVTPDLLKDMFAISETTLLPYNREKAGVRITAIKVADKPDINPLATVDWSRANAFETADKKGVTITVPQALRTPGAYYIKVEVSLDFKPLNSWVVSRIPMREVYYLAPRYTNTIPCDKCT